ncbi:MAG: HAD family phosphatase [Puniceicoccales bacterium]|nr:HAD family phosphatase [Puniceicoccales bacterium]
MEQTTTRTATLSPPPGHFAAYIFDCDGTLAATMRLHYAAWLHAIGCQYRGTVDWSWENFCTMGGMSIEDTVDVLQERLQIRLDIPRIIAETDAYLDLNIDAVEPCADALDLARQALATGIQLAVASGGFRWRVERTLRAIHATELFPVVVASEDVARVKPAPDLFLLAAKKLGVSPTACLVVEDSPKGREAATAAGMACLLVAPR